MSPVSTPAAAQGHFGKFGGRFVPEALIAALDELLSLIHISEPTRPY